LFRPYIYKQQILENMANFKIIIKDTKAKNKSALYLTARWEGNNSSSPLKIPTGISVHPKNWQGDKTLVNYQKIVPLNANDHSTLNTRLGKKILNAQQLFNTFEIENGCEPTRSQLSKLLEPSEKGGKLSFFEFIDYFIKNAPNRMTNKGTPVTEGTIDGYKKVRRIMKAHLKHSIEDKTFKRVYVDFDAINMEWYDSFINYCLDVKEYSINYTGTLITNLKTILNDATDRGFNKNKMYQKRGFKVLKEEVDNIALDESELAALFNVFLPIGSSQDTARDYFLVGAWTGLRAGDFVKLKPSNFDGNRIRTKNTKTKADVVIPINNVVRHIYNKHNENMPRPMTILYINRYIKEFAATIPCLRQNVTLERTILRKRVNVTKMKWQWITTHTARRSFATIMYKKNVPMKYIMAITGHKTETQFLKYIKITPEDLVGKIEETMDSLNLPTAPKFQIAV